MTELGVEVYVSLGLGPVQHWRQTKYSLHWQLRLGFKAQVHLRYLCFRLRYLVSQGFTQSEFRLHCLGSEEQACFPQTLVE